MCIFHKYKYEGKVLEVVNIHEYNDFRVDSYKKFKCKKCGKVKYKYLGSSKFLFERSVSSHIKELMKYGYKMKED